MLSFEQCLSRLFYIVFKCWLAFISPFLFVCLISRRERFRRGLNTFVLSGNLIETFFLFLLAYSLSIVLPLLIFAQHHIEDGSPDIRNGIFTENDAKVLEL